MYRIDDPVPPAPHDPCCASLKLGFTQSLGTTRLTDRRHSGPLRVQKPLYPEGPQVCHAILIHPPGGVVGGDQLAIEVKLGEDAAALLTTPGAAKWYKANGHISRQEITCEVGANARLEWLPQETIFYDAAAVELSHHVALAAGSSYIGSEILCFGRTASGERFASGRIRQQTSIRLGGRLLWFEQGQIDGGGARMFSPLGLAGHSVCATLIAAGGQLPASLLAPLRELGLGATLMKQLLVVRYLGDSSEVARQRLFAAWQLIRPLQTPLQQGRAATLPRIWQT